MARLLKNEDRFAIFMVLDKPIQYLSTLRWHNDIANTICCGTTDDKFESIELNPMTSGLYPKIPSAPTESSEPKYGGMDLCDVAKTRATKMVNEKEMTNEQPSKVFTATVRGSEEARRGDPIANMSQADKVRLLARYAMPPCEESRRERKEMKLSFNSQAGQTPN